MNDETTIQGSGDEISDRLADAEVPGATIERLLLKAGSLTDRHAHTWKCKRQTVLCEDVDPGSTTGRKHGYNVTCTVTYSDGSSEVIEESYGC